MFGSYVDQFKMAAIECEFVERPPNTFQTECPICLLVLRQPYRATCCGKSFCKECIERVKSNNPVCPTCKHRNLSLFPNKELEQSLYDFQVYCSHKSQGCEWTGELRELDKHLNSEPPADQCLEGCPHTVINCPLSCTGCEVRLPRKNVKIHVNDDLIGHLVKQTAMVTTLMQDNKFLKTQLQIVSTQLQNVSTDFQRELQKAQQQFKNRVTELEEKIEKLEEVQKVGTRVGQPIGPVELIMTNFQQRKLKNDVWFSLPFHTHLRGYKLCLSVNASGWGDRDGTHLSVSVHMMRGEFDDQLKWPFRGDVTVQLLNQEEDGCHVVKVIPFKDHHFNEGNRVTVGERSVSGWGYNDFLPLAELEPRYLKNDCIKFCIGNIALDQ